jgi:CheY-like chemotaxis protein
MNNGKPTLLCVDDVPEILKAYAREFRNDFNVVTAQDPEQATILAPTADVILSDWRLETCTAKQFLSLFPNKPTVVLSGTPGEVELEHAWAILTKPCPARTVIETLLEALGR